MLRPDGAKICAQQSMHHESGECRKWVTAFEPGNTCALGNTSQVPLTHTKTNKQTNTRTQTQTQTQTHTNARTHAIKM